jgi:uncharacterized membrane protein YphA (DoxX/SURF4 family)
MAGQDLSCGRGGDMKMTWKRGLILILRLGFGALLIFASIDKIQHPYEFAEVVENYRVLGPDLSRWVAVFVPYLEALTGLLLVLGVWLDAAVSINAMLMVGFLFLVLQAFIRGLDINCGCFMVAGEAPIGWAKIIENTLFAGLGGFLLWLVLKSSRNNYTL